jgi:hypothetical protein
VHITLARKCLAERKWETEGGTRPGQAPSRSLRQASPSPLNLPGVPRHRNEAESMRGNLTGGNSTFILMTDDRAPACSRLQLRSPRPRCRVVPVQSVALRQRRVVRGGLHQRIVRNEQHAGARCHSTAAGTAATVRGLTATTAATDLRRVRPIQGPSVPDQKLHAVQRVQLRWRRLRLPVLLHRSGPQRLLRYRSSCFRVQQHSRGTVSAAET